MEEIKKYNDNGTLWLHYFKDNNGKVHGVYKNYYITGELAQIFCFDHGSYRGLYKNFNKKKSIITMPTVKILNKTTGAIGEHGIKIEFNY